MSITFQSSKDAIELIGAVTLDNVSGFTKQLLASVQQDMVIDCRQLEPVNSACVALMIELSHHAQRHQLRLSFSGVSEKLRAIIEVAGLQPVLSAAIQRSFGIDEP